LASHLSEEEIKKRGDVPNIKLESRACMIVMDSEIEEGTIYYG